MGCYTGIWIGASRVRDPMSWLYESVPKAENHKRSMVALPKRGMSKSSGTTVLFCDEADHVARLLSEVAALNWNSVPSTDALRADRRISCVRRKKLLGLSRWKRGVLPAFPDLIFDVQHSWYWAAARERARSVGGRRSGGAESADYRRRSLS